MGKRKRYSEAFKQEAVQLMESRGERTIADIAATLGVAENLLHSWRRRYGAQDGAKAGSGESVEQENERLRREVAQLRKERDILKKSVAFFVKENT